MRNPSKLIPVINAVYFPLAAIAAGLVVYESWNHGFFLKPWPAILTGVFLFYLGLAAASIIALRRPTMLFTDTTLPKCVEWMVRPLGIGLPMLLIGYAAMVQMSLWSTDDSMLSSLRNHAVIGCEEFLFGPKRAEYRCNQIANRFESADLEVSEHYRWDALDNAEQCNNPEKRVQRCLKALSMCLEKEGKLQQALHIQHEYLKYTRTHSACDDEACKDENCDHKACDHHGKHTAAVHRLHALQKAIGDIQVD